MAQMWTETCFPGTEGEFIGNSEIVSAVLDWAKRWNAGERQPPVLLWGQSGSGKTCLAYFIARKFKWDVLELNSSNLRSKDIIESVVGAAANNASVFGSRRLILLDEVDSLTRDDRGGAGAIASIIKETQNPVILTANDIYASKSVSALRFICKSLEFKKINYLSMAKRLREILAEKNIPFDEDAVKELAKNSNGDMRSALLDTESISLQGGITMENIKPFDSRERGVKVFEVMKSIFRGNSIQEVRDARFSSDLSPEMLVNWVEENIPRQYRKTDDVALAFDRLSRSDVFQGRIFRRQHWGFLSYAQELACEGVALSKAAPSFDFVVYQFPGLLSMLSKTSAHRAMKKELGKKIGSKTHSSSRKIISSDLPYLKDIFKNREKAVGLSAAFGLDEAEIAFLMDKGSETKAVQSIVEEIAAIKEQNAKPKFDFVRQREEEPQASVEEDTKIRQTKLF